MLTDKKRSLETTRAVSTQRPKKRAARQEIVHGEARGIRPGRDARRRRPARVRDAFDAHIGTLSGSPASDRRTSLRLRALDEERHAILLGVAHDMRSPLMAIAGLAEMLAAGGAAANPDRLARTLACIRDHAARLARAQAGLGELERLNRTTTNHGIRIDLGALTKKVVREVTSVVDGRDIKLDLPRLLATIDAGHFARIVDNLVSNVLNHTPPGTPFSVRLRRQGPSLLLEVADRGPGVPEELKEAIFKPWCTSSVIGEPAGMGIGLVVVSRLASLLGGNAWVENRPGGGAVFCVAVPEVPL